MITENEQMFISDGKLIIKIDGTEQIFSSDEVLRIVKINTHRVSDTKVKKKAAMSALFKDIDKNFATYRLDRAAEFLKMSRCHFSRYFHKKIGLPFFEYINRIKVSKAIELIRKDDMLIRDIVLLCGFNNPRNFNRVFMQHTGHTPSKLPKCFEFKIMDNRLQL